jgi:hypothetical protein
MPDVDPALEQEVLHFPPAQRKADIHQHHQPDNLWREVEAAKRALGLARTGHVPALPAVDIRDGLIAAIYIIRNLDKLRHLDGTLKREAVLQVGDVQ